MLPPEKVSPALYAIHTLLVRARFQAGEGVCSKDLFQILDYAEVLPSLVAERPEDTTEEFRSLLIGLGQQYPAFRGLVENFDKGVSWSDAA